MAEDREVLREIWDGKLPVCFILASEEVFTVEHPEPIYLLVSRQSYFPLVTDKVHRHFLRHVDPENHSEMWLEDDGQPLRWHYPIGLLFDISLSAIESKLPWTITVHFQNFPEHELLHCPNKEVVEAHFISMVKEADSLKHRGNVISGMQKKDHKQLWMGLLNDKFDQFWSVNRKLMEHVQDELFRYIPFRIHQGDKAPMQKLYRPLSDGGQPNSLEDLLKEVLPEVLPTEDSQSPKHRIVIHGIEPPLETPVQWLSEHFSHPDNFVHICIQCV